MVAAIGDIHGELGKLERLLDKLEPLLGSEDTILFIGDYIDRGPDSKGVVDLVLQLPESINVITLRGNHEQLLLDARNFFQGQRDMSSDLAYLWFSNGADQTLASYPPQTTGRWYDRIPPEHWAFFESTLMEAEIGHYHFVHAGIVPPGKKWADSEFDPRLWIREEFLTSPVDFGKTVVFGHTPMRNGKPLVQKNKIGIDTAAAYGGPLTAALIDSDESFDGKNIEFLQSN